MKPLSLTLKNFMNHRSSEIDCTQFSSALIVGKSKENPDYSNGVGKTTIFNAIEYALFNKMHNANLESVVRYGQKKCEVFFEFEVDGDKYRLHRKRYASGSADLRLSKHNGEEYKPIDERTASETDDKLREIVKISHQAFCHSILFRQADLDGISEEKDGNKRKNVLKEPLNLARYSRLEKVVKEKISPIRKDITHHQGQIDNIGNPKEDIETAQAELDKCLDQHVATAIKAGEVVQTIERKREELDVLKSKLSRGDSEIHVKVAEQERTIKDLNKRVRDINEGLRVDHQRIQELDKKRIEIDRKIADLNTKLTELRSKDVEDLEEIKAKLKKVREDELKGTNLITKTEVQIEQRQLSLPKDDKCSTCYQPISKDYRSEFEANINSQIKELQEERDHYVESLRKCRDFKKRLEGKVQAIEEHYNEITLGSNAVKTEKTRREDVLENAERLMEQIKRQEKQQEDLSTQLQEASERYDKLKELAKQSDAAELNAQISALQQEIRVQEETSESFNQQLSSLKQKEGSLRERLKTRSADKDKLKELKQQMVKLRRDLSDWKMVAEAFSPKGIPTYIIHTVLDELQQETNAALRTLRPELEVQFDSELNITYRRFGQVRDYNILSYGQKVYIALAFKRGLSKVIQRRLGVDLQMLIFDEVDSPMDRAGQDAVVQAVRAWSQDFKVFVITHNDRLKDKFTHAILVEEGDDGTEARVVTQW